MPNLKRLVRYVRRLTGWGTPPAADAPASTPLSDHRQLELIVSKVHCLLWVAEVEEDAAGELQWANRVLNEAWTRQYLDLECAPDDDYAHAWYESHPEEDRRRMNRTSTEALRRGRAGYRQKYRSLDRRGRVRWFAEEAHIEPLGDKRWQVVGVANEITEIQQAESRFEAAVRHVTDGLVVFDGRGTIEVFNPAAERIFGYAAEEAIGQNIALLSEHPERPLVGDDFREAMRESGGRKANGRHKTGRLFPIWFDIDEYLHDGMPMFVGVVRDISAAERAARRQELFTKMRQRIWDMKESTDISDVLQVLHQESGHLGLAIDYCGINLVHFRDGEVSFSGLALNTAGEKFEEDQEVFGGELLERTWREKAVAYRKDLEREDINGEYEAMRTYYGTPIRSVIDIGFSHGTLALNSVKAEAFSENDIELLREIAAILSEAFHRWDDLRELQQYLADLEHEVVERVETEKRLKSYQGEIEFSNALLKSQQEATQDGILLVDNRGTWVSYNQRLLDMWAIDKDGPYMGSSAAALPRFAAQTAAPEAFLARVRHLYVNHKEDATDEIPLKDGRTFERFSTTLRNPEGKMYGRAWYYRDITEQKQHERALEEAKEHAEEANVAKSAFLANMSHELRTPMNAILGMTELSLESRLDDDVRQYLRTSHESAELLLQLLNDLLDFAKIEAMQLELERHEFSLEGCLRGPLRGLAHRAAQKGVELLCHLHDVPDGLVGDPHRLQQILINLVGNAVKFTAKGEIVVEVAEGEAWESGVELLFVVRDTGVGIPAEKQESIFDPFIQADVSTTRTYGGTGLGLAICKQLVELMQGRIQVASEEGAGSTFSFSARFGCAERPAPEGFSGQRLLVVDGNATGRGVTSQILESWGLEPRAVADCTAALEALRGGGEPVAAAVIDADTLGTDALETAERIRRSTEGTDVPLLLSTHSADNDLRQRIERLERVSWLPKPLMPSELQAAIRAMLDPAVPRAAPPPREKPSLPRRGRPSLRVLLAEDTKANQVLMRAVLEKQGHGLVIVDDGLEALAAWERERFDLVLMDVQMPNMDGMEATREIRRHERERGGRVPIVALTAHALKGDEKRILDAGMDAYVSKPIQIQRVLEVIDRLAGAQPEPERAARPPAASAAGISREAMLEHLGGDEELLALVIPPMLAGYREPLGLLRRALGSEDADGVAQNAHALKGILGAVGPNTASAAASEVEEAGRTGKLAAAADQLDALEAKVEALMSFLAEQVEA